MGWGGVDAKATEGWREIRQVCMGAETTAAATAETSVETSIYKYLQTRRPLAVLAPRALRVYLQPVRGDYLSVGPNHRGVWITFPFSFFLSFL